MNLIEGVAPQEGGAPQVSCHDITLPLPRQLTTAGAALLVGLRPEHLAVCEEQDRGFPVEVELVEQMGAQTLLVCRAGPASLRALIGRNDRLRSGERIRLDIAPQNLHFFDPESGRSLLSESA